LVYSRVNPAEQGAGVERLLPPTEEPMDRAEHEVTQVAQAADDGFPSSKAAAENRSEFRTESPASNVETTYQKAEPTKETTLSVEQLAGVTMTPKHKSEAKKEEVASEERVAEPTHNLAATAKAPAKKESAASKTLQTGYRIQLASMKSQDQAKQEWVRLQGEFKGALGGLSPNFTRVDLGAKKGVFFRVHAGDFSSKGEAQNVCNKMKSQNPSAGCFIVKF
jgi:septal ring-binding cell division protein DamX